MSSTYTSAPFQLNEAHTALFNSTDPDPILISLSGVISAIPDTFSMEKATRAMSLLITRASSRGPGTLDSKKPMSNKA